MDKQCKKCLQVKNVEEFYRHPRMADGRLNKCKDCARADVTENRKKNADYYKNYDRLRWDSGGSRGVASDEAQRKASQKWARSHRAVRHAHAVVQYAERSGELSRPEVCEACRKRVPVEAHHEDYAKPLDVRWLCKKCHAKTWRKERQEMKPRKRGGYVGRMLPTRAGETQ